MIGVDTNVLSRLFVADDVPQHRKSQSFFAARTSEDPAFLGLVVIAEFVWLLDRIYKYPQDRQIELLTIILASANVTVENRGALERAMEAVTARGGDLADALIAACAAVAGCTHTVTFDRGAAKRALGVELLK
jgi:predicted nucleic-acid-binding protein